MKNDDIFIVGDTVLWRGSWGMGPESEAVILNMQVTAEVDDKEGLTVEKVWGSQVKSGHVLFDLDNGHWAYSSQISKITS